MGKILESIQNTVIAGFVLMLVLLALVGQATGSYDIGYILRYIHVLSGVMWIGLLWYFNFVQIPTMPSIPDEMKPAIGKHIAPKALWWFRWGRNVHAHQRFGRCSHEWLHGGCLNCCTRHAPHWYWHVDGDHHVVQCLVRNLAKPEDRTGHCGS